MQVIRNSNDKKLTACVVTIGSFDGLHLGHQQLLAQTKSLAERLAVPAVALTFEPLPQEYFQRAQAPARLSRLREKIIALEHYSYIDFMLALVFNKRLANLSPQEFVCKILIEQLAISGIVVGADFRFGHQGLGNLQLLQAMGKQHGFLVEQAKTLSIQDQRISSTRIRSLLAMGELEAAEALLGRPYSMTGKVIRGEQRGRQLGFPTANILLKRKVSPLAGVYLVRVLGYQSQVLWGVANVGNRPTVDGSRSLLEVYVFDFQQDLYGLHLQVEFLVKIRPEHKFNSLADLQQQIQQDVNTGKELLDHQRQR
jgi:riboflavin kinase/FMN adenylyltransferase